MSGSNSAWIGQFSRPATAADVDENELEPMPAAKKPAAKKPAAKKPAATQGGAARATAGRRKAAAAAEEIEPTEEELEAERLRRRALVSRRGPAKRAATYRLEEEILDMVDAAVVDSIDRGKKLTKDAVVANAIRKAYGRLL